MDVVLWCAIGGIAGLALGTLLGFAAALALACLLPDPGDGTFAMRQMVLCLPFSALAGLVAGAAWVLRR